MEPVVQYSQKDPLYDPNHDNLDDSAVNKNEIYAQPKILNVHDHSGESYGPPFGSLPTAPLYSHGGHPHYYESPEPIIEIIIKESNETLPAPPPQPIPKKKKEPVQVFYVKYSKDPHSKDKVVYEKPIPAITPPSNHEDDHNSHEDYVTVTPEPLYIPHETTTLRALIKPESELYHSDSSVKVTFGNEGRHYSDRREGNTHSEDHEETAPRPAIAYPQQAPNHPPLERSVSPKPQFQEPARPLNHPGPTPQTYRPSAQHAQSRIQFQPPYIPNEQQLPRQGPSISPFRAQALVPRPQGPSPSPSLGPFSHNAPGSFSNSAQGPIAHFSNSGPNAPSPVGPTFPPAFSRPNTPPSFHSRQNPPSFAPRPHFNGPPRTAFHSGPQRPFHQQQAQPFFDEPKYLQENYHTITTEQVDPPKDQLSQNRPPNFNFIPKPSPSPSPAQFQEHLSRPQHIPNNQNVPQQRPPLQFLESHNKPTSNRTPFFNLKPSPPHVEDNRPPFHQFSSAQLQPQQPQFSFHQGPQSQQRPTPQTPSQQNIRNQHSFPGPLQSQPSPIPHTQFLPQPSSPPLFNFHAQPSPAPEQQNQFHQISPSERPHFALSHGPSESPFQGQANFNDQSNLQHQQNVGQFVPKGGELVAAIPKYEQHITVSGPNADYSSLGNPLQPTPEASHNSEQQYREQHQRQQQEQHQQHQIRQQQQEQYQQQQRHQQQRIQQQQQQQQQHQHQQQQQQQQQQHQQQQQQQQQQHQQQQHQQLQQQLQQHEEQQQQQQQYDAEQEQVRLQLAQNVQKQQEEIQRLQSQLLLAQQQPQQQYQQTHSRNNYNQQQFESSSPKYQFSNERPRQPTFATSTSSPPYYQSTSRTVEIKPTTQKYVSSTLNSISPTPEAKKEEKKKQPAVELPDEVPDDLRQQLLSSGILDNADISILDYDKVGETPLDSLPPDQLANFFSAGGAQQIAASENRPIVVKPNGDFIQSRIDDEEDDDQEIAASENIPSYVAPPPKQAVEMKVVHFDPKTDQGQNIAKEYVKEDATQLEPVALNDKKYNRYLPLKVSGNQFPLPDILKGRKVTSVVVLAPVETEALNGDHTRAERATSTSLKGIKFIAGDSLQDLLKRPSKENFEKWIETEKKTDSDLQSVVLLVLGNDNTPDENEIFMYDVTSGNVNKLSGELSNAFVEAAENNSLSKDIEKLAIEGDGTPENFDDDSEEEKVAEGSENVPLLVDLSGLSLHRENNNQVSISSGYSKTKLGRSLRRQ